MVTGESTFVQTGLRLIDNATQSANLTSGQINNATQSANLTSGQINNATQSANLTSGQLAAIRQLRNEGELLSSEWSTQRCYRFSKYCDKDAWLER